MNIKEAKSQVKNAITAYFTKDRFGNYRIPVEKQRPVFLMGPPGVGKTAIMEQIAQELDVALVSYSMTHHTRQSALGLPFIETKTYGGKEYSVSEYTMSEIIASIYDTMEETGKKEGILFLDEINCVSETLAPSMLQFLQYKIFGRHRVPDGWIVVTAGNPPEYNNSVREFDIVTWDRLKRMNVDPDYTVWKEYAYTYGVHPAITTYLDIKTGDFYKIESSVDGKTFVTARGWSDLSDMIKLYEENDIPVDRSLVVQYLQNQKISADFATYYELFRKYKSDYQVDKILDGKADESIVERAKTARFDERLSLLGLLIDAVSEKARELYNQESVLTEMNSSLKKVRMKLASPANQPYNELESEKSVKLEEIKNGKKAQTLSADRLFVLNSTVEMLEKIQTIVKTKNPSDNKAAFILMRDFYQDEIKAMKKLSDDCTKSLNNVFTFCEKAFDEGQEILILVTELTANKFTASAISRYGCDKYFQHNSELLFYERQKDIIKEISLLDDMDE